MQGICLSAKWIVSHPGLRDSTTTVAARVIEKEGLGYNDASKLVLTRNAGVRGIKRPIQPFQDLDFIPWPWINCTYKSCLGTIAILTMTDIIASVL